MTSAVTLATPTERPFVRILPHLRTAITLVTLALYCVACATAAERPNILLILADDLGYGDVGCYNSEAKAPTPNLDRLAAQGMRFTDAHSPSTVCTPTRYSLLTGRMAFRTGMRGVFDGVGGPCLIEPNRLTLGGMLQGAGYRTAMVGKWHVGLTFFDSAGNPIVRNGLEAVRRIDYRRTIPDAPIHRGFHEFFGTACCPTTDWLYAFIEGDRVPVPPTQQLDRTPLPKHPYSHDNRPGLIAPDFDLEEVDMTFLQRSVKFLEEHAKNRSEQPFFLFHSAQAVHLPSFPSAKFRGRTQAGPHGDFIFEFDAVVGELLNTLERLSLDRDTLVIVTSDNGPEVGSVVAMRRDHGHDGARPWRGMKRDQWEGGHRVPLLVRWPGEVSRGAQCDRTVCLTDVMATCADLLETPLPDNAAEDSLSFLPLLRGMPERHQREYTIHQTISLALAIRQGPWKFLDHPGSGGNNYDREPLKQYATGSPVSDQRGQLYRLDQDPGEQHNLIEEHPDIAARLKAQLDKFRTSGRSR
ncbi:MAG: sulfatase-like hydrolase/transferase [Planctomycetales bacterium]|nr:sulfatase-like hydrolase/transferase [Planctomycetales bacterium]